jgi:hypothetical protein
VEKHLFLDLEDTIISPVDGGWHTFRIINEEKIQNLISVLKPKHVHIFSFAIGNNIERDLFNTICRPAVERAIGFSLEMVPTVDDDILPAAIRVRCMGMVGIDFVEMTNFWGKEETFKFFLRDLVKRKIVDGIDACLLDDCVIEERWEIPSLKIIGRTINALEL